MTMPVGWLPLCGTVLALGLRHGLDADHLAAIDGLTRYNSTARPLLARWCGALFSLGHGGVVLLVASLIGAAVTERSIPGWMEGFGDWVSIVFLVALGCVNLWIVLRTPASEVVRLAGVRGRLFARLLRTASPVGIIAIGALFAVSFDTLTQAALFSATAARFGGAGSGLVLGALFMLGMALVDGANGAWVASLVRAQGGGARMFSRAAGLLVATLSFAVAALEMVRYFNRDLDLALAARETLMGAVLGLTTVGALFVVGRAVGGRAEAVPRQDARRLPQV